MKRTRPLLTITFLAALLLTACGEKAKVDASSEAPPPAQVTEVGDPNLFKVDNFDRIALVSATTHTELPELHANGVISADVDYSVPVISLASGRALAIYAKLGDDVKKGQLLLKVQSNDVSNAYQNYHQARADEELAKTQLDRSKLLYEKGAIALNDLQVAQDTETKARVALEAAEQMLTNLGASADQSSNVVNIYAPVSGTIIEQNIVQSASVHSPDNQPNLFTIANLAHVWALCDVYENDLPMVRLGDKADVQLNAYPGRVFHGRISNIGKVLDPNTRSAKVRIVLDNPGMMRTGMFVTATFIGQHGTAMVVVPTTSVLHLHDKDWVFIPVPDNQFRRLPIIGGRIIDNNLQLLQNGISPGQQVVRDALSLEGQVESQ